MTTGFFTINQMLELKMMTDAIRVNSEKINDIIQSDLSSPAKQHMTEGQDYYNANHDILSFKHYYYVDGVKVADVGKANNVIPHPFHQILVDQKVAYVAGNPIVASVLEPDVVDSENPTPQEQEAINMREEFQQLLTDELDENFDDLNMQWIRGSSNKGVEWVHFYIDPDGVLRYIIVPAQQCIPIYDTQYQERLVSMIRFYYYDLIDASGKAVQRRKVESWSDTEVEYWVEIEQQGIFVHDPFYEINPAPHWFTFNTSKPGIKTANSWGRVPFVSLWNNNQQRTDLQPIKKLIDAYDQVVSGWCNDLEDLQEMIYVIKGYKSLTSEIEEGLSELAVFVTNLKTHKVIAVDEGGGVETLKVEIPVEAKMRFLQLTREAIFYFGQGVDVSSDKFGGAPSGVALKFLYASLDMKCNELILKLKKSLKEFCWFVVYYINMVNRTDYDWEEVTFTMTKAVIFNENEKISSLSASKDLLSKKTLLENHPYVTDVNEELSRLDAEKEEAAPAVETPAEPPPTNGQMKQEEIMN